MPTLQQLFAHLFDKIDFYVFLAVFHKQRLVGDQNEIKLNKLKCASKKLLKDDTTIDIPLFNTRLTEAGNAPGKGEFYYETAKLITTN